MLWNDVECQERDEKCDQKLLAPVSCIFNVQMEQIMNGKCYGEENRGLIERNLREKEKGLRLQRTEAWSFDLMLTEQRLS